MLPRLSMLTRMPCHPPPRVLCTLCTSCCIAGSCPWSLLSIAGFSSPFPFSLVSVCTLASWRVGAPTRPAPICQACLSSSACHAHARLIPVVFASTFAAALCRPIAHQPLHASPPSQCHHLPCVPPCLKAFFYLVLLSCFLHMPCSARAPGQPLMMHRLPGLRAAPACTAKNGRSPHHVPPARLPPFSPATLSSPYLSC